MFRKGLFLLLIAVLAFGALSFVDGVDSPGVQITAARVIGSEASLAVEVLADVFVALGRAAFDALGDWLQSLTEAAHREAPAVHRLPAANPPAS